MKAEAEVSLEVSDDRLYCGLWSYMVIGVWSAGVDIVADPYSRAELSEVIVTGALFCDCSARRPQVFSFTASSAVPPAP